MNLSRVFIEAASLSLISVAHGFASELRRFPHFQVVQSLGDAGTVVSFVDGPQIPSADTIARYQQGGCRIIVLTPATPGIQSSSFSVAGCDPLDRVVYQGPSRLMEMFFEWTDATDAFSRGLQTVPSAPNPVFQDPRDLGPATPSED